MVNIDFDYYKLEQIHDFILDNFNKILGLNEKMPSSGDADELKEWSDRLRKFAASQGVECKADEQGFFITKNGILYANLPRTEIVRDKHDRCEHPDTMLVNPAQKIQIVTGGMPC
ncbi:hypothetical protein N9937_00485 [bacterium]|nr:hypothetical protein [bacterium]